MQPCCPLHFLPSFYSEQKEDFSIVRYRKNSKMRRVRCGTLILNRIEKKVLLIQSYKRFWGLPKGHVEENETLEQCALRETLEETGIQLTPADLGQSFSVYNGDGVYFVVRGDHWQYNLERLSSKDEITGIAWFCLGCLHHYMTNEHLLINSHFRALLPVIDQVLCTPVP